MKEPKAAALLGSNDRLRTSRRGMELGKRLAGHSSPEPTIGDIVNCTQWIGRSAGAARRPFVWGKGGRVRLGDDVVHDRAVRRLLLDSDA